MTQRPLRAADLTTDTPTPENLLELVAQLPRPDPEKERAVRQALERSRGADAKDAAASEWPPLLEEPRRRADSRYADPATSHRPVVGPVLVAAKRAFRLAFQPFINEVLRRQVEFNESILGSLALIYEQVRVNARTQALQREELEARLRAMEEQLGKAPPTGE